MDSCRIYLDHALAENCAFRACARTNGEQMLTNVFYIDFVLFSAVVSRNLCSFFGPARSLEIPRLSEEGVSFSVTKTRGNQLPSLLSPIWPQSISTDEAPSRTLQPSCPSSRLRSLSAHNVRRPLRGPFDISFLELRVFCVLITFFFLR